MYKCLKDPIKYILKCSILILIPGLLFIFYYIVNYMPITIPKKEAAKINLSKYVPSEDLTVLTFINKPDENHIASYTKKIIKSHDLATNNKDKKLFRIYYYDGKREGALTSIKSINATDNSIVALSTHNTYKDTSPDEIELSTSPSWVISENEKAYLTGKNLTVDTIAGSFSDCLEVTTIKNLENGETQYNTIYSAPIVGAIMKKTGTTINKQEKVYELTNYVTPNEKSDTIESVNNFINRALAFKNTPLNSNVYKDDKLGISLKLPDNWSGDVKVDTTIWADNVEHSTAFILNSGNKLYQKIFSIQMLKKGYDKEYVDKNPELKYIGEYNGHTLVYKTAKYYTKEIWYNDNLYLKFSKMLSETEGIIKSISKL